MSVSAIAGFTDAQLGETLTATVDMTVLARKVRIEMQVPSGPTQPVDLMPLFNALTDTLVRVAVENAEADGQSISCRKGCGACCRQLVPISEIEVLSLRRIVGALPAHLRANVEERFSRAVELLRDVGLLERLRAAAAVTRDEVTGLGVKYFEQGIPCPFLEDESCSIHAERPLACREYLVVSPAAHCAKPTPETINCVKVPAKVSRAVRHLNTGSAGRQANWIPMILALEWPFASTDGIPRQSGPSLVATVFNQITGTEIPEPPGRLYDGVHDTGIGSTTFPPALEGPGDNGL